MIHYSKAVYDILDILGPEVTEDWVINTESTTLIETIIKVTSGSDKPLTKQEAIDLAIEAYTWED